MNILFTICARAGSKGLEGKNVKLFCGKPLVTYTLNVYKMFYEKYPMMEGKICLAINTDSELLLQQIKEYNIEYIEINREKRLAGDAIAKKDVISDTLQKCEEQQRIKFDFVIDLDLTSPLRTVDDVVGTLETLLQDEGADLAYSVTESRRSPYFNMVQKNKEGYYETVIKSDFVARQQVPVCYDMNASIYVYRRAYLLNTNNFEKKALIWIMEDTGVLDIDGERDFELMEVIARYCFEM